jgi:putative endonuclease
MKIPGRYFVYITTNQHRTVLYVGITNDVEIRAAQHQWDALFGGVHFTGRYQAFYVIYYEVFYDVNAAIARETEIKGWRRRKKLDLIKEVNAEMRFLNEELGAGM